MSDEMHKAHGGRIDRLERDVGDLKEDFATVKADLRGFATILGEIKQGLNNSRPAWYVLLPILLSFLMIVAGGIFAFASLKTDIASLSAIKDGAVIREQRQWDLNERVSRLEGKRDVSPSDK